jgi:hypothetical protein
MAETPSCAVVDQIVSTAATGGGSGDAGMAIAVDYGRMETAMKRVYSVADPSRLAVVRGLLADAGVETTVFNEATGAATGEIPFFLAGPEVWVVRDQDEERARQIIAEYESGEALADIPREPWQCPRCGEHIEGQFTECWNCRLPAEKRGDEADPDPRHDRNATCEKCGYALWGLPERRCPECGTRF